MNEREVQESETAREKKKKKRYKSKVHPPLELLSKCFVQFRSVLELGDRVGERHFACIMHGQEESSAVVRIQDILARERSRLAQSQSPSLHHVCFSHLFSFFFPRCFINT